jgi:excisionase family DNA binding protein
VGAAGSVLGHFERPGTISGRDNDDDGRRAPTSATSRSDDGVDRLLELIRSATPSPSSGQQIEPEALNKMQAAALLSVSERTMDRLVVRGEVPCIRLSRRCVRFSRSALMQWIESKSRFRRR